MSDNEMASLATLMRGEVIERFDLAMTELAQDILDPDKNAEATRKITLTLKVTPNKRRDQAVGSVEVKTSFPANEPTQTLMYVGQRRGRAILAEHDARQEDLFHEREHPAAPAED